MSEEKAYTRWWESDVFRKLFGRCYYKVCYYNPILTRAKDNKFPEFIETDGEFNDMLYWFDLNYLGYAF